jgi:hypothetical protein
MKDILKKYSYQIRIIVLYTILLMVVYGYMTSVLSKIWWTGVIVGSIILIGGFITLVVYINKQEKKASFVNTKELNK